MYAEEFSHSSAAFLKILLCEITQNSTLKSTWLGTLLKQSLSWINLLTLLELVLILFKSEVKALNNLSVVLNALVI